MTATVIIPTTGVPEVRRAIESVLSQNYPTTCYLVCDGEQFSGKVTAIASEYLGKSNFKVCYLPINVGSRGFYGHRVYAAFSHLVDTNYISYLDQDNWFDEDHLSKCSRLLLNKSLDWCYSLRKIHDKDGNFICNDDCESLGKWNTYHGLNHIDTNSYFIRTNVAIALATAWHGGWGQDRIFYSALSQHFPNYDCTKAYTVNYRVDGGPGSVNAEFFMNGNKIMNEKYNGEFPWKN